MLANFVGLTVETMSGIFLAFSFEFSEKLA